MNPFEASLHALPADSDGEPGWLGALRRESEELFRARGLPTPRDEDWRYTDLGI